MYATALKQWQNQSQYCTKCGSPTQLIHAGTCRLCTTCQTHLWPRQDPSIIVSITSSTNNNNDNVVDDYILLARSKRHPPKVHTLIAGFVEAGETMEDAVIRESLEETGVHIDPQSIRYVKSQPWPFPQSTMLGFTAKVDHTQPLHIDTNELVSAEWFHRSTVLQATNVNGNVNVKGSTMHMMLPKQPFNKILLSIYSYHPKESSHEISLIIGYLYHPPNIKHNMKTYYYHTQKSIIGNETNHIIINYIQLVKVLYIYIIVLFYSYPFYNPTNIISI